METQEEQTPKEENSGQTIDKDKTFNKLKEIQEQKEDAANADSTEDYQKAADLKTHECQIMEQIDSLNKKVKLIIR